MPKSTDSDVNRSADHNIIFNQIVDCPRCGTESDVLFDTGAKDEDALADLSPGDVTAEVTCTCGNVFEAVYEGWVQYGSAG